MNSWLPLALLICTPTLALSQSLRCSDKVISTGSTRAEVASLCGEPTQVDHKTLYNEVSGATSTAIATTTAPIELEMWVYNFGPNRLMQRIWFQDGVITRIESMGYGF